MKKIFFSENLHFLREQKGLNKSQMPAAIGFNRTTWQGYEAGKSFPNLSDLMTIAEYFDISETELLKVDLSNGKVLPKSDADKKGKVSGKVSGKVYQQNDKISLVHDAVMDRHPKVVTLDNTGQDRAVLVPIKARAGYLTGYTDPEYIGTLPAYNVPGLSHGNHRLFEVQGNSMLPTLHDKDICIGQHVENLMQIRDDMVHIVVTKDNGIVVKRVLNRLIDEGVLVLKSDNYKDRDLHPTQFIKAEEVLEIWYVQGFISGMLRPPSEPYTRLIDLEVKMILIEDRLKKGGL